MLVAASSVRKHVCKQTRKENENVPFSLLCLLKNARRHKVTQLERTFVKCMVKTMGSAERELLFYETFNHEGSQVRVSRYLSHLGQNLSCTECQGGVILLNAHHENRSFSLCSLSQELHVDLIRFPLPVVVKEVRIISSETKACSELAKIGYCPIMFISVSSFHVILLYIPTPNSPLYSHTTPSSFSLDIFCNDSSNPLAPTFDPLGT